MTGVEWFITGLLMGLLIRPILDARVRRDGR